LTSLLQAKFVLEIRFLFCDLSWSGIPGKY